MNQREIKFRAWIVPEKKMVPVFALRFSEVGRVVEWLDADAISGHRECIAPFNQVLMLFTGLKAKDGREVYEGDMVRGPRKYGTVVWSDHTLGWMLQDGEKWHALFSGDELEILGNQFENPELLQKVAT